MFRFVFITVVRKYYFYKPRVGLHSHRRWTLNRKKRLNSWYGLVLVLVWSFWPRSCFAKPLTIMLEQVRGLSRVCLRWCQSPAFPVHQSNQLNSVVSCVHRAMQVSTGIGDIYTGWTNKKSPPIFQKIVLKIANEIRFLRKVKVWFKHYNTIPW